MTSEGQDGNPGALLISIAVNKLGMVRNQKQSQAKELKVITAIEILMSGVFKAFDTGYIITALNIGIGIKWTIHVLNFCRNKEPFVVAYYDCVKNIKNENTS